jgi:fructokinase
MSRARVVALGELLWDLFPDGRHLGGAPANVARHARSLGADAVLVSRVGRDALGEEAVDLLRAAGFPTEAIQRDASAPTGTAGVSLDGEGQPCFAIRADAAWDRLEADGAARRAVADADAICFGTLARRAPAARRSIQELLAGSRPDALRVLDVNRRPPFGSPELIEGALRSANVVKLSEEELGFLGLAGGVRDQIAGLARRFGLRLVALTRGAEGSLLYSGGDWSDQPGLPVRVRDAVGAGDAFTAALTLGLLRGLPLDDLNRRSNELAAYVCTQPGATPRLPADLVAAWA